MAGTTRYQVPITLTLKMGIVEVNYPSQSTNANGYFTVTVNGLPNGTYDYRVKGPKYLANTGQLTLSGDSVTNVEMGLMMAGDCNNDNVVNVQDIAIIRASFGKAFGDPGYDDRADLNGDLVVNITDYNLAKRNFGIGGAPPIGPVR